jgi:hypothetical protein
MCRLFAAGIVLFSASLLICSRTLAASPRQTSNANTATTAQDAATANLNNAAQTAGAPLTTVSEISTSITVDAVLLPYSVAKRSFGKETARNYAVVHMTISNRDPKQSLILQSALLDYSQWLFNGTFTALSGDGTVRTESYQAQNKQAQVSSTEVRTVRGDLEDAQLWTVRNWVLRSAVAVGSVAAGLTFVNTSSYFAPAVSVYSGAFVPALGTLWPDNTQAETNLISDIGFRTNRVIPANSSDVVIAFFPLDRFLTPQLKKLYFHAPAAFFNPSDLLLDKKESKWIFLRLQQIGIVTGNPEQAIASAVMHFEGAYQAENNNPSTKTVTNPCTVSPLPAPLIQNDCVIVSLLNRLSLNNIRLVIGGVMSVNTATVPALVSTVTIANDTLAATWKSGSKLTGTVTGSFFSGASIAISGTGADGTALPSTDFGPLTIDTANASDSSLPFSITLGADIPTGTKLTFVLTKKAGDGSTTTTAPFSYTVAIPPTITAISVTNDTTAATWNGGSTVNASLTGTNLNQPIAQVSITGVDNTGKAMAPSEFTNVHPSTSTATGLPVTFTLGNANIPAGSKLSFIVTTNTKTASSPCAYIVPASGAGGNTGASTPCVAAKP